jgi:hypothetical protein
MDTTVTFRRVVSRRPLLWVSDPKISVRVLVDQGVVIGERACSQLPRQTAYFPTAPSRDALRVFTQLGQVLGAGGSGAPAVRAIPARTPPLCQTPVEHVVTSRRTVAYPKVFTVVENAARSLPLPCLHTTALDNASELQHIVLRLDGIGMYHLELTTRDSACIVLPSEVPDLKDIVRCSNRAKTKLAFLVGANTQGRIMGLVGCGYLHVFLDATAFVEVPPFQLRAKKLTYMFRWKPDLRVVPGCEAIADAVKATVLACVDGEIVDTPFREQTVWTGDCTVLLRLLPVLADNPELSRHVTALIAATYNPELGMVAAIAPAPRHAVPYIPSYHLLFCLLLAQLPDDHMARAAKKVIHASIQFWREHYLRDGLVTVPGRDKRVWHFVDWSANVVARNRDASAPECNAVLNSLWIQLHKEGVASSAAPGVDMAAFEAAFGTGTGAYKFVREDTSPSLHATTNTILAGACRDQRESLAALQDLVRMWGPSCKISPKDFAHGGPTFFYGNFVCDALKLGSLEEEGGDEAVIRFAKELYGPMARKHGTLIEKKVDDASLAHSWSVGVGRHVFVSESCS